MHCSPSTLVPLLLLSLPLLLLLSPLKVLSMNKESPVLVVEEFVGLCESRCKRKLRVLGGRWPDLMRRVASSQCAELT